MVLRPLLGIYRDHAAGVLARLQHNPGHTIPILLSRLKLQRDQLQERRKEQVKGWRETAEKNFYKSLNHRAFYFRQSEKKNTNTKCSQLTCHFVAFVAEIKARFEKRLLATTPASIKKGGAHNSVYFNSLSMVPPEHFHTVPAEGDEVARLSNMYTLDCDL